MVQLNCRAIQLAVFGDEHSLTADAFSFIIFDTAVTQKRNCKHANDEFISIAILRVTRHHKGFCAVTLHTSTVVNMKIARSER